MSQAVLDAALAYAARGWAVLPVRASSKVPLTAHGVYDATIYETTIREWWAKCPSANVGIACGSKSAGLVVLDVDEAEMLWQLEKTCGPLPVTRRVRTGRGTHHYFLSRDPIRTQNLAPGIELRGKGSYVLAPPSLHPNGTRYQLIDDLELAPLPNALRELLAAPSISNTPPNVKLGDDPSQLSRRLRELTETDPQIKLRWYGDPLGLNDSSRSAVDLSLASLLVNRGFTDAEIADALRLAPYNKEWKGLADRRHELTPDYLARTIAKARSNDRPASPRALSVATAVPKVEPSPAQVEDGAVLLREVEGCINSLVILPAHTKLAVTCWVLATHCFDFFWTFPYLAITSPTPRCGKTRSLEVLECLVHKPHRSSNISEAALYRVVQKHQPTLLLDEVENLGGKRERAEALRGLLNSGY
ncbi:MAG: hypothetical protein DMG32_24795, partial [Acidobacteria bacterium]